MPRRAARKRLRNDIQPLSPRLCRNERDQKIDFGLCASPQVFGRSLETGYTKFLIVKDFTNPEPQSFPRDLVLTYISAHFKIMA
jgi:hypothetical protein